MNVLSNAGKGLKVDDERICEYSSIEEEYTVQVMNHKEDSYINCDGELSYIDN